MYSRFEPKARQRFLGRFSVIVLMGAGVVACTTAATTPGLQSLEPSALASSSPAASASATSSVSATPMPTATPQLPTPGPLPSGNWTSVRWTKVPVNSLSLPTPAPDGDGWTVVGWSRGWLAFQEMSEDDSLDGQSEITTIDTSHSADGLRWEAGGQIKWDGSGIDVMNLVEGPSGLLAYDFEGTVCGSVSGFDLPVAMSADGISWKSIDDPAAFAQGGIQNISGGSAGYIATGLAGVWTSTDGMSWGHAALTGKAFKGLDGIENGVAFADGYVIAGQTYGPETEGCGEGPTLLTPSLWWSADGRAWTRDKLSGAIPGAEAWMDVYRLNDHLLLAGESNPGGSGASWASSDGRTWKSIPTVDMSGDDELLSNGQQTLILSEDASGTTIYGFRDDLTVCELAQSGDIPDPDDLFEWTTFGPTGLLTMDDQGNTYVGVPVAG